MIRSLRVAAELRAVEVDVPQIPGGVALRLVTEVRRAGIPTLASGGDRLRPHAVGELDHGEEAVAARAVPFPGVGGGLPRERCQRAPDARGEGDRDAGLRIVEAGRDIVVEPLEPVDLTPGDLPGPEASGEAVHR